MLAWNSLNNFCDFLFLLGHRFLFKTKIERRKHWEAQQAAMALETPTENLWCTHMPSDLAAKVTEDRVEVPKTSSMADVRQTSDDIPADSCTNIPSGIS